MDDPLVHLLWRELHRRVAMIGRDKPLNASKREARSKINCSLKAVEDYHVDRSQVYAW